MLDGDRKYFRFHSEALPDDALLVTRLEGHEELSQLYRFELDLVSKDSNVDLAAVLREKAWVGISEPVHSSGGGGSLSRLLQIHGMVPSFELIERRKDVAHYRAVLQPRLWKISQEFQSRIFLDRTIPQIIEDVLKRADFGLEDYELRLTGRYSPREFVVQYEESDLDFLQRWTEHEGIYYFFEQTYEGEKVVFADSPSAAPKGELRLPFRPPGGADKAIDAAKDKGWLEEDRVEALACSIRAVPRQVVLKDYNWRLPSVDLRCSADVSPDGVGTHFEYNNHYKTQEEGNALAKVRAEERRCRIRTFTGESNCRAFRAGIRFELEGHFRHDFNDKYLLTRVHHSGTQEPMLLMSGAATTGKYRNDVEAIPAAATFRPLRRAAWPAIKGVMNATVDGSGTGQYAEVDAEGRYKVILPFDLSGRVEGKASRFVRMQQPYSGNGHGMHFPLHKGAEVLLTFVDGDPDRPIISGTVPNPANPSIVTADNHTAGGIRTAGGNSIEMEDADGHQRIHMGAGSGKSQLVLGSGSEDRAELTSWTTTTAGVIMNSQYGGFSSSSYAGKKITLETAAWWAVLIPTLLTQQYPRTLAANALSGAGLKLPLGMQTESLVELFATLLKYGWNKHFLDSETSRFDDLGGYLLRWKGTTRMELHGGKGEDLLIGSDKGQVRLQSGSQVKIRSMGDFGVQSSGEASLMTPTGRVFVEEDGAGIFHWTDNSYFGKARDRGYKEAIKATLIQKLGWLKFWGTKLRPAAQSPDVVTFMESFIDKKKPRCYLLLDDDGILLRMETGTPTKVDGQLAVRENGLFATKKSLMLAGGGGPEKPKDGPFIDLDKSITIDCSKDKDAEVVIKAAKDRSLTVDDVSITLDMGDGKTSLTVWDDGDIDITGGRKIIIEGQSISLNSKSKTIDCNGATLTNCPGIK